MMLSCGCFAKLRVGMNVELGDLVKCVNDYHGNVIVVDLHKKAANVRYLLNLSCGCNREVGNEVYTKEGIRVLCVSGFHHGTRTVLSFRPTPNSQEFLLNLGDRVTVNTNEIVWGSGIAKGSQGVVLEPSKGPYAHVRFSDNLETWVRVKHLDIAPLQNDPKSDDAALREEISRLRALLIEAWIQADRRDLL